MAKNKTKVISKRRKFQEVEVPLIRTNFEILGENIKDTEGRCINLDLTRQLKGKNVEATFKIKVEDNKAIARPIKIKLMSYFIRRMIRNNTSYVEDSFIVPSQESMLIIKPFIITRKKVSKSVRKTLRNKAKNWIEDYIIERKNGEIFNEILSNRMQKQLSLILKKTYPLSLCEIRVIEIQKNLTDDEKAEVAKKIQDRPKRPSKREETIIDQIQEIEDEKLKVAEEAIRETQKKASEREIKKTDETLDKEEKETKKKAPKKEKKTEEKETDKNTSEKSKKKISKNKEPKEEKEE